VTHSKDREIGTWVFFGLCVSRFDGLVLKIIATSLCAHVSSQSIGFFFGFRENYNCEKGREEKKALVHSCGLFPKILKYVSDSLALTTHSLICRRDQIQALITSPFVSSDFFFLLRLLTIVILLS